jgi:cytoskeletal protein RodZ
VTALDPHDEGRIAPVPDVRFERADVAPGVIVRWAIGLGLLSVVSAAVAVWLLVFLRRHEEAGDPQRPPLYFSAETRQPEGVRLQSKPFDDLATLREQEKQVLGSYGWVDPAAGTVRIPIESAMKLYIARQSAAVPVPAPAAAEARVPTDSAPVPAASAPTEVTTPPPLSESAGPSPSPSPAGGHP